MVKLETREGQIILYYDYANPIATIGAWGGTENLQQAFNPHHAEDAA
ncbi:MAG: hypothetical protein JOZ78_08960 [Chroococcidiopsidaceae cyanobacterium CP_BM_ER_R8_30]|nr:hypothetical protein [Chroococcidiopsidaceae cyanobacterium CP_BM_ER_R8_30]